MLRVGLTNQSNTMVGAKATNALSESFKVISQRQGAEAIAEFKKGELVSYKENAVHDIKTGTTIIFKPDKEIFKEGTEPTKICDAKHKNKQKLYNTLKIAYPLNNMTFAIDKRISINRQAINFEIYPLKEKAKVYWSLDGKIVGSSDNQTGAFEWMPKRGEHRLQAIIYKDNKPAYSQEFKFEVK